MGTVDCPDVEDAIESHLNRDVAYGVPCGFRPFREVSVMAPYIHRMPHRMPPYGVRISIGMFPSKSQATPVHHLLSPAKGVEDVIDSHLNRRLFRHLLIYLGGPKLGHVL